MDEDIKELRRKIKEEETSSRTVFSDETSKKREYKREPDYEVDPFGKEEKTDITYENIKDGYVSPEKVRQILKNPTKKQREQLSKLEEDIEENEEPPVFEGGFHRFVSMIGAGMGLILVIFVGYMVLTQVTESLEVSTINNSANTTNVTTTAFEYIQKMPIVLVIIVLPFLAIVLYNFQRKIL